MPYIKTCDIKKYLDLAKNKFSLTFVYFLWTQQTSNVNLIQRSDSFNLRSYQTIQYKSDAIALWINLPLWDNTSCCSSIFAVLFAVLNLWFCLAFFCKIDPLPSHRFHLALQKSFLDTFVWCIYPAQEENLSLMVRGTSLVYWIRNNRAVDDCRLASVSMLICLFIQAVIHLTLTATRLGSFSASWRVRHS